MDTQDRLSERDLTPTVHVTDRGRRIHVRLTVPDPTRRPHPTVLLREAFPRHSDAVWLPARSCWSLPGHDRVRVCEWASRLGFRVVDEQDATLVRQT